MSTRRLTPNDPHAPQRARRRFLPWSFVLALVLGVFLMAGGTYYAADVVPNGEEDASWAIPLLGVVLFLYALVGGPVYKWGPSGILFILGVLIVLAGVAGGIGTRVAEDVTITLYEGDDDGDERIDEDDYGDADGSENDPTQISGLCELQDHDDDDSDCEVDEDPAPIYQTSSEVRTGLAVSRDLSIGAVVIGFLLLVAFAFIQNSSGRRDPPAPPAPTEPAPSWPDDDAPTTTRRDGGGR